MGGDVLVGLHRWETLTQRPPVVDALLKNMKEEMDAALAANAKANADAEAAHKGNTKELSNAQVFTELGLKCNHIMNPHALERGLGLNSTQK